MTSDNATPARYRAYMGAYWLNLRQWSIDRQYGTCFDDVYDLNGTYGFNNYGIGLSQESRKVLLEP